MVDTGDIVRVKILKGGLWKSPRLHSSLGTYHMEFMSLCPTQMFSSWDSCDKEMHPNAPNGQISAHTHSLTHSYRHRAFEELKIFGWLKNTHWEEQGTEGNSLSSLLHGARGTLIGSKRGCLRWRDKPTREGAVVAKIPGQEM